MKSIKKIIALLLVFSLVWSYLFVPANAKTSKISSVKAYDSVSGSSKQVYIAKGKTKKLVVKVSTTSKSKKDKQVSYKSSNKKIVTVSKTGVLKGKKVGSAKVTVTSKSDKKKKAALKVTVAKGMVKSVSLNRKKATVKLGEKLTLKTTVKASKGAVKKVVYSSSAINIATVNSKGVVTAKGEGTAVITAKAVDGSGKKATCKVSVIFPENTKQKQPSEQEKTDPNDLLVNMKSVNIPLREVVEFSLNQACALTKEQVEIKKRRTKTGNYICEVKIRKLITDDQIHYTAIIDYGNELRPLEYVQVTVASLSGSGKSMDAQFIYPPVEKQGEQVYRCTVGQQFETTYAMFDDFQFKYSGDMLGGYLTYELSGLPAGLEWSVIENTDREEERIEINGTPTVAGQFEAKLKAQDEKGNVLNKTVKFAIGSNHAIAGVCGSTYAIKGEYSIYGSLYLTGGSNSYKVSITENPLENVETTILTTSDSNKFEVVTSHDVPAGDYTYKLHVVDANNEALSCDVIYNLHVRQGIKVTVRFLDNQGNLINGGSGYGVVTFYNQNQGDNYCKQDSLQGVQGEGSVELIPGTYNVMAIHQPEMYLIADSFIASDVTYKSGVVVSDTPQNIDIKLNLNCFDFVTDDKTIQEKMSLTNWYWNDSQYVGTGSRVYVKPGQYTLETTGTDFDSSNQKGDWYNGGSQTETTYKLSVEIPMNSSGNIPVKKTNLKTTNVTYAAGKNTTIEVTANNVFYVDSNQPIKNAVFFKPTTTKTYHLRDSNTQKIYNEDGTMVGTGNNVELKAGEKYFISTGTFEPMERVALY